MKDIFRRHGSKILAVLGVLLMIVWLKPGGGGFGDGGDTGGTVRGTVRGIRVTNNDLQQARKDVQIWSVLVNNFLRWDMVREIRDRQQSGRLTFADYMMAQQYLPQYLPKLNLNRDLWETYTSLEKNHEEIHAFLLLYQVKQAGLSATPAELADVNDRLQLSDADVARLFRDLYRPAIDAALRDMIAIQKYNRFARNAVSPSRPELEHFAVATGATVQAQFTVLDANAPELGIPEPDPALVQKTFDTYKDRLAFSLQPASVYANPPVRDGHTWPFGYMYPDRVKVEYLIVNFKDLKARFPATPQDVDAAYAYFLQHPELAEPPATAPAESQPATTPATTPATKPALRTFEDPALRAQLIDAQVDQRVRTALKQLTDQLQNSAAAPFGKTDAEGFKTRDPKTPLVSYEALAEAIVKDPRFGGYRPIYKAPGTWQDANALAALPGIGTAAFLNNGLAAASFPDLALHIRELDSSAKKDPIFRPLQGEVDGPLLNDRDGNVYFYRVIASEKAHVPATLDDGVRAQVVADLKRAATFERYQAQAQQIAVAGATRYLAGAASERKLPLGMTQPFPRMTVTRLEDGLSLPTPAPIPGLTEDPRLRNLPLPSLTNAAFKLANQALADTPNPSTQPSPPATAPAPAPAAGPIKPYLTTVPVESRLQVFVLQVRRDDYSPLPSNKLSDPTARRTFVEGTEAGVWTELLAPQWNRLRPLAARLEFKPEVPWSEE